jgi:hypothetical protein
MKPSTKYINGKTKSSSTVPWWVGNKKNNMQQHGTFLLVICASLLINDVAWCAPYTVAEREAEYHRRRHTWPLEEFVPDTQGWARLMQQRFAQVRDLTNMQEKWDGWIETMASALTMPNMTQFGWGLTQAPQNLTDDLRTAIYEGLPHARLEGNVDVIDSPMPSLFIDRPDLTQRALQELQPILESWAGMELVPEIAYGFRLYRNESRLWMHKDRTQTHVISCILHIASSEDSEPWPIVIEDYAGNTNQVFLKAGDILLYESAKNLHGRPRRFIGSWYTSLFVHFYPKGDWSTHNHDLDAHYAFPPTWDRIPGVKSPYPKLKLVGTSMLEPECPDYWCNLENAVQWEGPGEYGKVLTTGGKRYSIFDDDHDDSTREEL